MRYAQEQDKARFFINRTKVLFVSDFVGAEGATFSGSGEPSRDRALAQTPPKWLNRRIIPDDMKDPEEDKNPGMDQTVKLPPPNEDLLVDDHQSNGHMSRSGAYLQIAVGVIIFLGLYITSLYSYLLFHSLAEAFTVVVGCGIFVIAWNARGFLKNNCLLFLGIAYLFVAGFDFLHSLAYKGMGVFPSYDANLPTQLWIAGRYLQSASLLIAPLFFARRLRPDLVFIAFSLVSVIVLGAVFYWNIFPDCYVEGLGLTPFKKISEYVICALLVASLILLIKLRPRFERSVFLLLAFSIGVTIGSELAFTFYVSVYGFSNLVGHFLKIIAFFLIYKAIIETGLRRPYDILLRELREKQEIVEQEKKALQNALAEVKKLSGLLPICVSCKKIRDDKGYWRQIEAYISAHSEALFSHSICPDCARKLYPERFT